MEDSGPVADEGPQMRDGYSWRGEQRYEVVEGCLATRLGDIGGVLNVFSVFGDCGESYCNLWTDGGEETNPGMYLSYAVWGSFSSKMIWAKSSMAACWAA